MKKFLAMMLVVLMLSALCACGSTETESAQSDPEESAAETVEQIDDTGDAVTEVADASGADTYILDEDAVVIGDLDQEKYDLALACVGESVEALYEAIGEPVEEPHYASSCMELGAEDGQFYYDDFGFYVTTLRNDESETVMAVAAY